MSPEPIAPLPVLEEEDRARADLYALLARLYYRGPDAEVLALIARAGEEVPPETASAFAAALRALAASSRSITDPVAVQQEYDDLFVGTGRAEVSVYAAYYLAETGREKVLVALRSELAAMGLSRKASALEPEDHFAALFDVMRHLIERGSDNAAALQYQLRFFARFVQPCYAAFCAALGQSRRAEYYAAVGALTHAFLDVENEATKMLSIESGAR